MQVSACGNEYLLNGRIRTAWGRPDAVVMSDCSAVGNMMKVRKALLSSHPRAPARVLSKTVPFLAVCLSLMMKNVMKLDQVRCKALSSFRASTGIAYKSVPFLAVFLSFCPCRSTPRPRP